MHTQPHKVHALAPFMNKQLAYRALVWRIGEFQTSDSVLGE